MRTIKSDSRIDHETMIYTISPVNSPFFDVITYGRYEFRRASGGSMRKHRVRKAKPIRFTPPVRLKKVHEWTIDVLQ